jgi:hypothetical protein
MLAGRFRSRRRLTCSALLSRNVPPICLSISVFRSIQAFFYSNRGVFSSSVVRSKLTPEEEDVRRLAFGDLPSRKVSQVLGIGSWTTSKIGEHLIEHGKCIDGVSLVVRGKVRVTRDERLLGDLVAGNLVRRREQT